MDYIETEIIIHPLSVNECWKGRRFKTPAYKSYEKELCALLPRQKMIKGMVKVDFFFGHPNAMKTDVDNLLKPLLDIITKAGYIEDDRYVMELSAKKEKTDIAGIRIKITKL